MKNIEKERISWIEYKMSSPYGGLCGRCGDDRTIKLWRNYFSVGWRACPDKIYCPKCECFIETERKDYYKKIK